MKITLQTHQNIFFTSDTHYAHSNICYATTKWTDPSKTRDFKSLDAMNSSIVSEINRCAGQDDIIFHLGDWSFGGIEKVAEFRNRLTCKNIHIITGNHDHHIENNRDDVRELFSSVHKYVELTIVKPDIGKAPKSITNLVLMHFPIASWNNMSKGTIHLHGHVHFDQRYKVSDGKMMDVGMDGNNMRPYSFQEIYMIMKQQPVKSLFPHDHHEVAEKYTK